VSLSVYGYLSQDLHLSLVDLFAQKRPLLQPGTQIRCLWLLSRAKRPTSERRAWVCCTDASESPGLLPVFHPNHPPTPKISAPSPTTVYIQGPAGSLSPPPPNERTTRHAHRRVVKRLWAEGQTAGDFGNRNAWVRLPGSEAKFSTRITGRFS